MGVEPIRAAAAEEWPDPSVCAAIREERQRLACALHDGPVQVFTAAALQVGICRHLIERGDLAALDRALAELTDTMQRGVVDVRQIMSTLRQPAAGGEPMESWLETSNSAALTVPLHHGPT